MVGGIFVHFSRQEKRDLEQLSEMATGSPKFSAAQLSESSDRGGISW